MTGVRFMIVLGICSLIQLATVTQSVGQIFFDDKFRPTSKEKASFKAEPAGEEDGLFLLNAYYLSGAIRFKGSYSDKNYSEPHGFFEYYFQNGNLESKGYYRRGQKVGDWERFEYTGTQRPNRIYAGEYARHEPVNKEFEPAVYPGGEEALFHFLAKNLHLSPGIDYVDKGTEVHVAFVILPSGRLTDFNVVKSGGEDADHEALRIAESMSWWEPAKRSGEPVMSTFILPIAFGSKAK